MSTGGKGDDARPMVISKEEFSSNWDLAFGKKKVKQEEQKDDEIDDIELRDGDCVSNKAIYATLRKEGQPKVIESISNREDFEREFLRMYPNRSLQRDAANNYLDPHVRVYWRAYRKAYNKFEAVMARNGRATHGLYFVGGYSDEDDLRMIKFAKTPVFHTKMEWAEKEAQRLANDRGGKFIVFGRVSPTFTKKT